MPTMTTTATTTLTAVVGNWATIGPLSHHLSHMYTYFLSSTPCRILLATWILWSASSTSSSSLLGGTLLIPQKRKFRQSTAVLSGMVAAFCTATYLMPLMMDTTTTSANTSTTTTTTNNNISNHHDIELAHVALFLLSVTAAFVGAALGSLLPRVASGATLGYGISLCLGASTLAAVMSFSSSRSGVVGKNHEEEEGDEQSTTNLEGHSDTSFTALYFAVGCPMAALLGGLVTTR